MRTLGNYNVDNDNISDDGDDYCADIKNNEEISHFYYWQRACKGIG